MGYTMSFDASLKLQRGAVRGYLYHTGRDVMERQGVHGRHSNPNIDSTRTLDNLTWVRSEDDKMMKECTDREEIMAALDRRLAAVQRPLRKDAVVLRPLILQLDPEYYREHGKDRDASVKMLRWAQGVFGTENIIAASLHEDEDGPHMHVLFCPVTDDGRLSQKEWFRSPKSLGILHDDLRKYMTDAGYDIEMKRKKPGKYARRMKEGEYRDWKELEAAQKSLEARESALAEQEARMQGEVERRVREATEARERALDEREAQIDATVEKRVKVASAAREAELDEREAKLARREKAVGAAENRTSSGRALPNIDFQR